MSSSRRGRLPLSAFAATLALACTPAAAQAADVAVLGNNSMDDFLASRGHTTTLVTDAQLASPGFLAGFDVFVYTRGVFGFGASLSEPAAANVKAFTQRAVLLNGDFADALGDGEVGDLVANAADWAAQGGGGYIGEFNGAVAALTANENGFRALSIVDGTAGPLTSGSADGAVTATAVGEGHPVLEGVALPHDPAELEFGSELSGVEAAYVLATFAGGNPAIIAQSSSAAPVVGEVAGPASADEGSAGQFSVSAEDPDGDDLTYAWSVTAGDATIEAEGDSATVSFGDGADTVGLSVTVSDGTGHSVTRSHQVAVANVAPVIGDLAITAPDVACADGNAVALGFTTSDPADAVVGTVDWGDATSDPFTSSPVSLTHGYAPGTYTLRVTASDDDGAAAAARTAEISLHYATHDLTGGGVHRAGRKLTVKVAVTDCNGAPVETLAPVVTLEAEGETVESGVMRPSGDKYIHNLSTKGLPDGIYELTVSDPSFAAVTTTVTLRS